MTDSKPKHIVLIVADSLRFDSVYQSDGAGVSYMEKNSIQFMNASSAACWTLPATASLFTGQLPHNHQATTQTRQLNNESKTLAEIMKSQGYNTYQYTSNVATTDIFGLNKGFDKVVKTWDLAEEKGLGLSQLLVLLGKPRIRRKLFSKDLITQKLTADVKAASVWFRSYYKLIFDNVHALLAEHDKRGESAFIFINLMETHFPYHIDTEFKFSSDNIIDKFRELKAMYSIVNQTFLTRDDAIPTSSILQQIKSRQSKSWEMIRQELDEFIQSIHEVKENLVVFTSDHGENFGDQNWVYHFSNVTDACTRVPIFWLDHNGKTPGLLDHKTSSRLLFHSLAKSAGYGGINGEDLFKDQVHNIPISQSFWYNNQGKTLDKFKFNQFCFHYDGMRYLKKNGSWARASATDYEHGSGNEQTFEDMGHSFNPIEEIVNDNDARAFINDQLEEFLRFEEQIKYKK
ncbi:MAG: sulfatase-like hydrolase/transferase [Saprospiraceae bacterium]|nr:sulfatase-like hydrolase/transferase [Saprospiraceae bacterium]